MFCIKMSKKIEKAAAAATDAATAAATAEDAYDSMSVPDIEIEEKMDADLTRGVAKGATSVSASLPYLTLSR